MRIDLFEFVEGVIRGVVYFLYNLIETLWQILRHPARGPARLHRAYVRKGQQQIGSLTLLFLFFFLFFGLRSKGAIGLTGNSYAAPVMDFLSAPPSLESKAAWVPLVGALVATVGVDAVLRAFFRWRYPASPGRRRLIIATVEYSLMWPLIALLASSLFYVNFQLSALFDLIGAAAWIVPAGRLLAGIRGKATRGSRRWLNMVRSCAEWVGAYFAMWGLVSGSVSVADEVLKGVRSAGTEERRLVPLDWRCDLDRMNPFADIVLTNPTRNTIMIEPYRDLVVVLATGRDAFQIVTPRPIDPDTMPVVFRPEESQTVRLYLPENTPNHIGGSALCFVREANATAADIDWKDDSLDGPSYWVYEWDIEKAYGLRE